MKAIKSIVTTVCLLAAISTTCSAKHYLSDCKFAELYTKEAFILEYGEKAYSKNVPSAKKTVQTVLSNTVKKGEKLQSAMFFQK